MVMISMPMAGKSQEQIKKEFNIIKEKLSTFHYVYDSLIIDNEHHDPLWYLSKSIEAMSHCSMVYFAKGWENNRGCRIEHMIAEEYRLGIMYEQ